MSSDAFPYQPGNYPTSVEATQYTGASFKLFTVPPEHLIIQIPYPHVHPRSRSDRGDNLCSLTGFHARDDARLPQCTSALRRHHSRAGNGCDRMAEWDQDRCQKSSRSACTMAYLVYSQPHHGAKKEGGLGFVKGAKKSFAGVIAKPGAGESVNLYS